MNRRTSLSVAALLLLPLNASARPLPEDPLERRCWLQFTSDRGAQVAGGTPLAAGRRPFEMTKALRQTTILICMLLLAVTGCKREPEGSAPTTTPAIRAEEPPTEAAPLAIAAARGDLAAIRAQLEAGAEIDDTDTLGRTALHMAAFYGRTKASELLLNSGADIEARDRIGMTPLHAAVVAGGRLQVELLLSRKADVNARSETDQTPLHLAAATGQPSVARVLIENGADTKSKDRSGNTPLFYASRNKHPVTADLLRKHAARD